MPRDGRIQVDELIDIDDGSGDRSSMSVILSNRTSLAESGEHHGSGVLEERERTREDNFNETLGFLEDIAADGADSNWAERDREERIEQRYGSGFVGRMHAIMAGADTRGEFTSVQELGAKAKKTLGKAALATGVATISAGLLGAPITIPAMAGFFAIYGGIKFAPEIARVISGRERRDRNDIEQGHNAVYERIQELATDTLRTYAELSELIEEEVRVGELPAEEAGKIKVEALPQFQEKMKKLTDYMYDDSLRRVEISMLDREDGSKEKQYRALLPGERATAGATVMELGKMEDELRSHEKWIESLLSPVEGLMARVVDRHLNPKKTADQRRADIQGQRKAWVYQNLPEPLELATEQTAQARSEGSAEPVVEKTSDQKWREYMLDLEKKCVPESAGGPVTFEYYKDAPGQRRIICIPIDEGIRLSGFFPPLAKDYVYFMIRRKYTVRDNDETSEYYEIFPGTINQEKDGLFTAQAGENSRFIVKTDLVDDAGFTELPYNQGKEPDGQASKGDTKGQGEPKTSEPQHPQLTPEQQKMRDELGEDTAKFLEQNPDGLRLDKRSAPHLHKISEDIRAKARVGIYDARVVLNDSKMTEYQLLEIDKEKPPVEYKVKYKTAGGGEETKNIDDLSDWGWVRQNITPPYFKYGPKPEDRAVVGDKWEFEGQVMQIVEIKVSRAANGEYDPEIIFMVGSRQKKSMKMANMGIWKNTFDLARKK